MTMENNENMILTEQDDIASDKVLEEKTDVSLTESTDEEREICEFDGEGSDGTYGDREEYRRLIKTKYKDLFTEDVERIVSRRVKKYKSELERLREADVGEQYTREDAIELVRAQEGVLRNKYDGFSLEDSEKNEKFLILAAAGEKSGVFGVEEAYILANFDSIVGKERERVRLETEETMRKSFTERRARPDENGLSGTSKRVRFDVSGLSKKERAEIAKRAAKGEKISF